MCGKDSGAKMYTSTRGGSPPHVRERLRLQSADTGSNRITPACAGKTEERAKAVIYARDHPRMCGKDLTAASKRFGLLGSPPHVRERPAASSDAISDIGITPACAGKTVDS